VTWLGDLGYPVPGESQVRAGVVYVTRYYTADPGQLGGRVATLIAPYPGKPRGGGVIRQEGNTFCVFFCGMVGDEPALDDEGLLAFAGSLDNQDVAEVMRESEPLGEAVKMRYPVSRRRHYEKLDRYLGGFLVVGDAMCSFNPIYGQGISAAALEALELRRLLAASRDDADLPRRYFRGIAKVTGQAWTTSTSGDLRFPQAEGRRSPADRLINAYLDRYRAAAVIDPELGLAFLRVANMIDPPARLLAPARVVRVLRSAGKGRRFSGQAR
jgi:2-polyprenyl-6-methoxyphenol hydroxylase-like FAD-dependent oxidoreductase